MSGGRVRRAVSPGISLHQSTAGHLRCTARKAIPHKRALPSRFQVPSNGRGFGCTSHKEIPRFLAYPFPRTSAYRIRSCDPSLRWSPVPAACINLCQAEQQETHRLSLSATRDITLQARHKGQGLDLTNVRALGDSALERVAFLPEWSTPLEYTFDKGHRLAEPQIGIARSIPYPKGGSRKCIETRTTPSLLLSIACYYFSSY